MRTNRYGKHEGGFFASRTTNHQELWHKTEILQREAKVLQGRGPDVRQVSSRSERAAEKFSGPVDGATENDTDAVQRQSRGGGQAEGNGGDAGVRSSCTRTGEDGKGTVSIPIVVHLQ